ncbi:hypothetical protein MMC28_010460 [Mycoblastus sanguinarius]|nr:hypothetical protein [Mycoblastus sanguinarius]
MLSQFITLFALFTAAALALPAAENMNQKRQGNIEVCTEATQGEACEVLNVSGKVVGGICEFDPITGSICLVE